jgi:hypothetical protein
MLDMHGESFIWSKPKVRGDLLPPLSYHIAIPYAKKVSLVVYQIHTLLICVDIYFWRKEYPKDFK